jgi:hypothetical protein
MLLNSNYGGSPPLKKYQISGQIKGIDLDLVSGRKHQISPLIQAKSAEPFYHF